MCVASSPSAPTLLTSAQRQSSTSSLSGPKKLGQVQKCQPTAPNILPAVAMVMTRTRSVPGNWRRNNGSDAPVLASAPTVDKTQSVPNRKQHHKLADARTVFQPKADELSMAMSRREVLGKARRLHVNRGTYEARGCGAAREKEMLQVIRNEVFRDVLAAVRCCRVASNCASTVTELANASRQQKERQNRISMHVARARPRAKTVGEMCKLLEEIKDGRQKSDAGWSALRNICLEAAGESCSLGVEDDETPLSGVASRALLRLRHQRSFSQPDAVATTVSAPAQLIGGEDPLTPQAASPPHTRVNEAARQKRRRTFFAVPTCANRLPQLKHAGTSELTFGR